MPPDAWALRCVYIREINRIAKGLGSAVRLFAHDRSGLHNPTLIGRAAAKTVGKVPEQSLCKGLYRGGWDPGEGWTEPSEDVAMLESVEEALVRDDIDGLVEVEVTFTDEPSADCYLLDLIAEG